MATSEQVHSERADATPDSPDTIRTSIVLPAYNESANVGPLVDEIRGVFAEHEEFGPYEIVVVDDGSTDGTRQVIRELADDHLEVVAILLGRNFGQSAALAAGIDHARGELVVTMDADRQNDPADVPRLLDTLLEGDFDCVSGWRRDRSDPLTKKVPSGIQTHLARWTGPNIHDFGCTLTAYRTEALRDISLYGEGHRYIPAKLHKRGYRVTELEVNHRPRDAGQTKYGWKRLIKGFVDLLFHVFWNRYSTRPAHFFGGLGFLLGAIGTLIGSHLVLLKYGFGQSLQPHMPRLIFSVALVLFGFQLLLFGFLAEMIIKLQYRDREPYRVQEMIGGK